MTPELLLQHFNRISEAPDAIARLRRFILDLAVRGKLVEQDPSDEPAGELLKRIQAEKARLVKEGKIKEPKILFKTVSNPPYDLPATWRWVPLGITVNSHLGGGTPSKNNSTYWDGDIYWASVKDIGKGKYVDSTIDRISEAGLKDSSSNRIPPGSLIVVTRMGLGKISINRVPIAINQDLRALFLSSLASIDYYYNFFKTHGFDGSGLTVKGIKVEELLNTPFPLPPLAEQQRIVTKVDELMALCDQLEAERNQREAHRDKLVAASLNRISTTTAEEAKDAARFHLNLLPRLTTKPEHIKQLRQTILNLAVRGKLVEQDPNDEPATELLKRIQAEKERLVKELGQKKEAPLPAIDFEQAPFDLPLGWTWARFPELGKFGRGKSKHRPRNDSVLFVEGSHLLIQTGDVARSQGIIRTYTNKYNDTGLAQSLKWPAGTLCITIAANIADSGILSFDACFPDSVVGFVPASMFENARYFEYFVRTAKADLLAFAPATAQKNINLEILNSVMIPLPPLAEQQRIVAKVDQLMGLCDQLEAQLVTTTADSRRLLEAVLHDALKNGLVAA
ncbi:restriction endonuclease subunit S [Trichlorobacter lovleyi]|uniref:restriction endonuclease subunit S n=1 Tax=Trichlorobacter lovleyi TaxID=313985 RepID=UPI00223F1BA6|nr:restriction endonuclease subunit S [Trichlorobacter lovleyi]QOX79229.1 restriction endonuclease subunit S [Trichlorobacter lovleyi]